MALTFMQAMNVERSFKGTSIENGLFLAKKLQEFVLTKSVCELIDFDFDPVLTNLGGSGFVDIDKLVIQGMNFNNLHDHYSLFLYSYIIGFYQKKSQIHKNMGFESRWNS